MSKIDDLIQQYCPDGVEYVPISQVCQSLKTGKLNANAMVEGGQYPFFTCSDKVFAINRYSFDTEALLVAGNGYLGNVKYYKGKFDVYQRTYVLSDFVKGVDIMYVYYAMQNSFRNYALKSQKDGSVPYITIGIFDSYCIPLPPLPVQEAIVNILDRFAEYTAELQAELKAELQARRLQYDYYRNRLLAFDGRTDVHWVKLSEVCAYSKERIASDLLNADNYVSVENLLPNQRGKEKANSIPQQGNCIKFYPNDILVGNIRPYLRKIWFADCEGGTNGDVLCFRIKHEAHTLITPRYLFCILSSQPFFDYDNRHAKGGKMPRGDKQKIMDYTLPIPPLAEQERIVGILDRFEALTNDLQEGLPAEIEARQQQYEYYRDRLLTFKRKEA